MLPIEVIVLDSDASEPEEGEIRGGAALAAGAVSWPPASPLPASASPSPQKLAAEAAAAAAAAAAAEAAAADAAAAEALRSAQALVRETAQAVECAKSREAALQAELAAAMTARRTAMAAAAAAQRALAPLERAACAAAVAATDAAEAAEDAERASQATPVAAPPGADGGRTTKVYVHYRGSVPGATDAEVMAAFAPFGPRCAHGRSRELPQHAYMALRLACGPAEAAAVCATMDGQRLGAAGVRVNVRVAPPEAQDPCTECAGAAGRGAGALKRSRAAAALDAGAPDSPESVDLLAPPPLGGPLLLVRHPAVAALDGSGVSIGRAPPAPAGLLCAAPGVPGAAQAAALLAALSDDGCVLVHPVLANAHEASIYGTAMALASHAAGGGGAGCLLSAMPRDGAEAAALAALPSAMSAVPRDAAAGSEAEQWRVLVSPLPAGADGSRLLRAQACPLPALRGWQTLLPARRLACALDLDETVVRAYRLGDLGAAAAALAAEGAASRTRAACAATWHGYLKTFALTGRCPALERHAAAASTFAPGAGLGGPLPPALAAYVAYRVPPRAEGAAGLTCDACLLRVGGEALLLCVRPGWRALRAVLRRSFWTAVATHAAPDYAATVVALLDPQLAGGAHLLRGGGEGPLGAWTPVSPLPRLPPAKEDAGETTGAEADAQPPCLTHIASFRRDPEPPTGVELIQKSFGAFRAAMPACEAFVAVDDMVGGRAAAASGAHVWLPVDAARVLCTPPFKPFGPPERGTAALEAAALALTAVHADFYARADWITHSGGDGTGTHGDAAAALAAAVRAQEARLFPTRPPGFG